MDTEKFSLFDSLRSRYLFATLLVALIVVLALYLSHYVVQGSRDVVSQNIANRSDLLQHTREIRESLLKASIGIEGFLIEPNRPGVGDEISDSLQTATERTSQLLQHNWVQANAREIHLERMSKYLSDLTESVEVLIETRKDPLQQYPSLALSNREMRPNRNDFNNAMGIAIRETLAERSEGGASNDQVLQELIEARHLWEQMVSNFRLYIANRLGSFNEQALNMQESGIETLYQGLQLKIDELTYLDEQSLLGFETSDALPVLRESTHTWYRAYKDVVEIHDAGVWRTDKSIIFNAVEPQMNFIWNLLHTFEGLVEDAATNDIKAISTAARHQEKLLWAIAALTISMLVFSFLYSNKVVFRPITDVTNALREEAAGREGIIIPQARSRETELLIEAFVDMKKLVRNRQLALEHKSLHDDLTGLPNRTLLFDRMHQSVGLASKSSGRIAVLLIGIENLKEINDSFGHNLGDQLIYKTSVRLDQHLMSSDTLSRMGEQEFAMVCSDLDHDAALNYANKLLSDIGRPVKLELDELHPEFRIGISLYPDQGETPSVLLQKASLALQQAELQHKRIGIYSENIDRNHKKLIQPALLAELKYAVKHKLLAMYYQPKVNIATKKIVGVEALLRWKNLDYGWVQTSEVITMVEKSGLIDTLTEWTLKESIQQYVIWRSIGIDLQVAINLSVYALQDEKICDFIEQTLKIHDVNPARITLEVTESAMMTNPKKVSFILQKLSDIGVKISADDFGTGFSSLTHLKKLPVNEIKIDKSFVSDMTTNDKDKAIVKSAIGLARDLGINVVAEGIEKEQTLVELNNLHCDVGQGYLFSKALSAKALVKWLKSQTPTQVI